MNTAPFRVSPSLVARYFFHDCELFLRLQAATKETRAREALPQPAPRHSALDLAIFATGGHWEQAVVEKHLAGRVAVAPGEGELSARRFSIQETLDLLRTARPGEHIYQGTLRAPALFYRRFQLDPEFLLFSDNHPDLIAVDEGPGGRRRLRVIDIKRADSVRSTHQIQVLLYALQLECILETEGIKDATVDLAEGGVWRGQEPAPDWTDLSGLRPLVEQFLREKLATVLRKSADDCDWHLYFRCEWCEYFAHCRDRMRTQDDLSRLANLTAQGKRFLRAEGAATTAELGAWLERDDADQRLERCASLAYRRQHLKAQVESLATGEPRLHGGASVALPKFEDVAVFITVQQDPLSELAYLGGLLVEARDEVRIAVYERETKFEPEVFVAATRDEYAANRRAFVLRLYELLERMDQHNFGKRWEQQYSLQVYLHNEKERALLVELLLDAIRDPELAPPATTLLFYFHGPELMQKREHPAECIHHPVVVLLNALGAVLALPVETSHTLAESLKALGATFDYQRKDYFHFPLGHTLRGDAIYAAWRHGDAEKIGSLRSEAAYQLYAQRSLLHAIRSHARDRIYTWPGKFYLAGASDIKNPLLSRLEFLVRYESLLACLGVRDGRAAPRDKQVLDGTAAVLKAAGPDVMLVSERTPIEIEEAGFPKWLLVRDSEEGRRAQLEYSDYLFRSEPQKGAPHAHRAVVAVQEVESDELGFARSLTVRYERPFKGGPPGRGDRFLLLPRFTDYTSHRIARFLARCDSREENVFLEILMRPDGLAGDWPLEQEVRRGVEASKRVLPLTPSQREAYDAIGRQRLTVVWGPPGTGKTHFLAAMLLGFAAAHAKCGKRFRALVTAFTHAAIENVLRKILALARDNPALAEGLCLGKAKYWQGADGDSLRALIPAVGEERVNGWLRQRETAIVGSTVYSCLKAELGDHAFDLVVVDEASQLRVPESSVPVLLSKKDGRLVFAGDDLQLPPIVQGNYPEPAAEEPVLHRSIFEALRRHAVNPQSAIRNPQLVRMLQENFRMNDVLTSYSGGLLYGSEYRCIDEKVARRRLRMRRLPEDDLLRACLDPAHPLVMVLLDGELPSRESEREARVVAGLVKWMRLEMLDETGGPFESDEEFFTRGLFIISPHHSQIRLIRGELRRNHDWSYPPFVDTVEKMQGQESHAVIISYGVSDPEYAMQEAEFIYGVNRLNVAITRAQAKSIFLISRALLEGSPGVWELPQSAKGLAYLVRLTQALRGSTPPLRIALKDGVSAEVLRASSVWDWAADGPALAARA